MSQSRYEVFSPDADAGLKFVLESSIDGPMARLAVKESLMIPTQEKHTKWSEPSITGTFQEKYKYTGLRDRACYQAFRIVCAVTHGKKLAPYAAAGFGPRIIHEAINIVDICEVPGDMFNAENGLLTAAELSTLTHPQQWELLLGAARLGSRAGFTTVSTTLAFVIDEVTQFKPRMINDNGANRWLHKERNLREPLRVASLQGILRNHRTKLLGDGVAAIFQHFTAQDEECHGCETLGQRIQTFLSHILKKGALMDCGPACVSFEFRHDLIKATRKSCEQKWPTKEEGESPEPCTGLHPETDESRYMDIFGDILHKIKDEDKGACTGCAVEVVKGHGEGTGLHHCDAWGANLDPAAVEV